MPENTKINIMPGTTKPIIAELSKKHYNDLVFSKTFLFYNL